MIEPHHFGAVTLTFVVGGAFHIATKAGTLVILEHVCLLRILLYNPRCLANMQECLAFVRYAHVYLDVVACAVLSSFLFLLKYVCPSFRSTDFGRMHTHYRCAS